MKRLSLLLVSVILSAAFVTGCAHRDYGDGDYGNGGGGGYYRSE